MKTSFEVYLKKQDMTRSSITSCERSVKLFLDWLYKQNIESQQVSKTDILAYMKYCQKKGTTQRTIQNYLNMIRHYYDHLTEEKEVTINPVTGIKVQGVKRKKLYHIFKPTELHVIYNSLEATTATDKRDKVILGLLVYQGLKTEEIGKLEIKDVKVKEGKIEVPEGRKSNGRILRLESHQVLELYDYLMQTRNEIIGQSGKMTEKLFIGPDGGDDVTGFIHYLLVKVGKKFKGIVNAKQLRASVITKWLRQHNLREVQNLAGHRYISSTEAYRINDMEGLMEEVNRYHPLG